jgi:hypothetical protein
MDVLTVMEKRIKAEYRKSDSNDNDWWKNANNPMKSDSIHQRRGGGGALNSAT